MNSAIDIDLNAQSLPRASSFPGQIILPSHYLKQMTADLVAARGVLENGLYIVPSLQLVVARTALSYTSKERRERFGHLCDPPYRSPCLAGYRALGIVFHPLLTIKTPMFHTGPYVLWCDPNTLSRELRPIRSYVSRESLIAGRGDR